MSAGEAAFPHSDGAFGGTHHGMSLRDWFAGQALNGVMSTLTGVSLNDLPQFQEEAKEVATLMYEMADAMIAARGDS